MRRISIKWGVTAWCLWLTNSVMAAPIALLDPISVSIEEPAAIANNPSKVVNTVIAVVNALSPGFDSLFNARNGQWTEGWSSSIWNFKSHDYLLASLRAGYGHEELIYSSLRLDLPGISRRFVPETIRGIATVGYLDTLWKAVGKYASVGPWLGYQFQDTDAVAWGVSLGGQVSF